MIIKGKNNILDLEISQFSLRICCRKLMWVFAVGIQLLIPFAVIRYSLDG